MGDTGYGSGYWACRDLSIVFQVFLLDRSKEWKRTKCPISLRDTEVDMKVEEKRKNEKT